MKNIFRFFGFLWLAIASVLSLINTIVEHNIFDAYVMIPLYSVAVICLILYSVIIRKEINNMFEIVTEYNKEIFFKC